MRFSKNEIKTILESALAVFIAISMFAYGVGKFAQFPNVNTITKKVSELSGMELMWAFYGYSKPFALIVGLLEVFGGLLLLFKRTRVFGCLLLTTVLVNIILQDFFYDVNRGALKAAILYQLALFAILFLNKKKVTALLQQLFAKTNFEQTSVSKKIIKLLAVVVVVFLFKVIEYFLTH